MDATKDLVKLGLELNRQEQSFARMTQALGVNAQALETALADASGGIADISASLMPALQALQAGLRPEQIVELMRTARQAAKMGGVEIAEAFTTISRAVASGNAESLRSLGIYVNMGQANERYAATLGTTASKLNEAGLAQARYAEIQERTKLSTQALSDEVLTQQERVAKARNQWSNLIGDFSKSFVNALDADLVVIANWAVKVSTIVTNVTQKVKDYYAAWQRSQGIRMAEASTIDAGNLDALSKGLGGLGTNVMAGGPQIKPPSAAELKKAADEAARAAKTFGDFQQALVNLAVADETAQKIMKVRQETEELAAKLPAYAERIRAVGAAQEATIVFTFQQAAAAKAEGAAWKETDAILSEMDLGLKELAPPLQAAGDLATRFAMAGEDVAFSLGGATTAVLTFREAFPIPGIAETVTSLEQFGPALTEANRAQLTFEETMRAAGISATVLGSNFDLAGARIGALRTRFDALITASKGEWTPEIQRIGDELRTALADQDLYSQIERGFLSITDTFTKMADGLIQGTLDIGDAFKNLGPIAPRQLRPDRPPSSLRPDPEGRRVVRLAAHRPDRRRGWWWRWRGHHRLADQCGGRRGRGRRWTSPVTSPSRSPPKGWAWAVRGPAATCWARSSMPPAT